jgi:hypothetical protein
MTSLVNDRFSITIDKFSFTLISKSVPDSKAYLFSFDKTKGLIEDRKKIMFQSRNLITSATQTYSAYTSVSELGMWRLCFLHPGRVENIYKFDNYIQATLLDIRLQIFINQNFDLLPFVSVRDATGIKQIYSKAFLKANPDIENDYTYIDGINPNGIISCLPAQPSNLATIKNRYIPLFPSGLKTLEQKSSFLEENYNLIQDSYNKISEYVIQLDNFQAHVEIYEIQAIRKEEDLYELTNTIVFQIGKFILDVLPLEEGIHREGYYIFNMKLLESKINEYGLYDRYVSGTCINPFQDSVSYYSEEDYITKPLNYIVQQRTAGVSLSVITSDVRENIKSKLYFFTAYKNEVQFPIKQIIQFTASASSASSASLASSASSAAASVVQSKTIGGRKRKKSRKNKKSKKNRKSRRNKKNRY